MNVARYQPYAPPVEGPLDAMGRADAELSFSSFLASIPERMAQLQHAVGAGVAVEPTVQGLGGLEEWLRGRAAIDAGDRERLTPLTYAWAFDIGIVLGEAMIRQSPNLRWAMHTAGGPHSAYFQRPVVSGFTRVKNLDFAVDPELLVIGRCHDFCEDPSARGGQFKKILVTAKGRA